MKVQITLDGASGYGTPLIMHSEVLADPLSQPARWLKELSKKRNRTEAEEIEMARREWIGGMYYDEILGPVLPTWNIVRSIQDGARMTKLGKTIERGVFPDLEVVPVEYDGPRDQDSMWRQTGEDGNGPYALRKGVKLSGRRVQRTRPIFRDWTATAMLTIDPFVLDFPSFEAVCKLAGRYQGIGDFRSGRYGRYIPEITLIDEENDLIDEMDAAFRALDRRTTDKLIAAATADTERHDELNMPLRSGNGRKKAKTTT